MARRKSIVPYHFGIYWDLLPHRAGRWTVVTGRTIANRLAALTATSPDIVVAGDCMSAIAAHRNGLRLVWYDAHGDYHTLKGTETGSLGGMPLAMLCGKGDQSYMNVTETYPLLPTEVYHVGGSEFDTGEAEQMRLDGVNVVSAYTGIAENICKSERGYHLHIDTDVISSTELPGAIHPAPNGMSVETFWQNMDLVLPKATVLSIKTPDPRLDPAWVGANLVLEVIRRYEQCSQS